MSMQSMHSEFTKKTSYTPLHYIDDIELCVKLEYFQRGQSHKARAAQAILAAAEERGDLSPNSDAVIIEKSGGNMAMGIATAAAGRYRLEFLVRPSFSYTRRRILRAVGARLIGQDEMKAGLSNQEILDKRITHHESKGRSVFFSDQFSNSDGVVGHRIGAAQLVDQLRKAGVGVNHPITLYKGVGTGGSHAAYTEVMRATFADVKSVVVQPEGCDVKAGEFVDHPIQGLAVGVKPALFRADLVDDYVEASHDCARFGQAILRVKHGLFVGPSTGFVFAAALKRQTGSQRLGVMIAYDGCDAYFSDDIMSESSSDGEGVASEI